MTLPGEVFPNLRGLLENPPATKTADLKDLAESLKVMTVAAGAIPNLHVLSEGQGEQMIVNSKDREERAKVMINPILENPARTVLRRSPSANFPTNRFPNRVSLESAQVTVQKARINLLIRILKKDHIGSRMKKDHLFQKGEPIQEKEGHTNRPNR